MITRRSFFKRSTQGAAALLGVAIGARVAGGSWLDRLSALTVTDDIGPTLEAAKGYRYWRFRHSFDLDGTHFWAAQGSIDTVTWTELGKVDHFLNNQIALFHTNVIENEPVTICCDETMSEAILDHIN